jgi:multisubunit Na+/H+ antiporter MnhB subunit
MHERSLDVESGPGWPLTLAVGLAVAVLTVVLGIALFESPDHGGLGGAVRERLDQSGVSNPVTAVLLNFRAYDTLLEIAVLGIALAASWALGPPAVERPRMAGPVLLTAMRWLGPVMVLYAGYLLWRGAVAPGGAFQAGSTLAAVGVLWLVAGVWRPGDGPGVRLALGLGLAVFLGVGLLLAGLGPGFLDYPDAAAKDLILLIEAAATISIVAVLSALFLGGRPNRSAGR